MPMRRTISWLDQAGQERLTHVSSSAGCPNTFNDLQFLSAAAWQNWNEGPIVTPAFGAPGQANYASITDVLALRLADLIGQGHYVFVPAPDATVFSPDIEDVNLANASIAAVHAAAVACMLIPRSTSDCTGLTDGHLLLGTPRVHESWFVGSAHPAFRNTTVWIDSFGRTFITTYEGFATTAPFVTAVQAISNAIVSAMWESLVTINGVPAPTSSIYASVNDMARLVYADVKGNKTSLIVPAPFATMFKQDRKTVDPSNVDIVTLTTDVVAECIVPASGLPVQTFIGGYLTRQKV